MVRNSTSVFLLSLTKIIFLFWDLSFAQQGPQCLKTTTNPPPTPAVQDPRCLPGPNAGGYKSIDNPRRSERSEFKPNSNQRAICDRALTWGWYRFTSYVGGKIPNHKVKELRCGTVHPIWMKGSYPTVKDGAVDRIACINFYDLKDGCFASLKIKVRNCGGYFVYYLGPTYSCSIGYCAGK